MYSTLRRSTFTRGHMVTLVVGFLLGLIMDGIFQNDGANQSCPIVYCAPAPTAPRPPCPRCPTLPKTPSEIVVGDAVSLPRWSHSVASDALAFQSMAIRSKCSDKCTVHRYQEIYARTLVKYRESTRPSKLLEIGLGCLYDKCALGGPMTFRQFLPNTAYHTLEIDVAVCKRKYAAHRVPQELSTYIDEHICHGSSADVSIVSACGTKFGPFDIVIDDGSHMLAHTSFAFRFWLKSPGLVPGGYLVIEDLQVTAIVQWANTAVDYSARNANQPAIARGTTVVNYAQSLMLCKTAGLLCLAPPAGDDHAMLQYTETVDQIIVASEAVTFRKAGAAVDAEGERKLTSDVIIALEDTSASVLDRTAAVLVLWVEGNHEVTGKLSATLASLLKSRFGVFGFHATHLHLSAYRSVSECVAAVTQGSPVDLIVVEVPPNSAEAATFDSQSILVQTLGSAEFVISDKLAVGGVVMLNGYQPRRVRSPDQTPDAASPRIANDVQEPLLRFVADFVMQHLVIVPAGSLNDRQWAAYHLQQDAAVTRAISYFSDASLDSEGAVFLRRGDPRHSRSTVPRDHL